MSDVSVDVLDVLKVEYKLISTKMITFCKLLIANLQLKIHLQTWLFPFYKGDSLNVDTNLSDKESGNTFGVN